MTRTKAVYSSRKYEFAKKGMSKAYAGHTSTAAQGGETIPTPLADYFLELIRDSTFLLQEFKHIKMTADTFEIPRMTGKNSAYLIGEAKDMTTEGGSDQASDSYSRTTWDSITLEAKKLGVLTGYSSELSEDSLIDVASIVSGLICCQRNLVFIYLAELLEECLAFIIMVLILCFFSM